MYSETKPTVYRNISLFEQAVLWIQSIVLGTETFKYNLFLGTETFNYNLLSGTETFKYNLLLGTETFKYNLLLGTENPNEKMEKNKKKLCVSAL